MFLSISITILPTVIYKLDRLSEDLDLDNSPGVDISHLKEDLLGFFQKTVGHPGTGANFQQSAT